MKNLIIVIVLLVIGWIIYSRFIKYPIRYVGYFYPSKTNLEKWIESPPLSSLDECQNWVNSQILYDNDNYDYECGQDCYYGDPYNQGVKYTCKTSVR